MPNATDNDGAMLSQDERVIDPRVKPFVEALNTAQRFINRSPGEFALEPALLEVLSRPDEFAIESDEQEGAKMCAGLVSVLGSGFGDVLAYWDFRDAMNKAQVERGISGLVRRSVKMFGHTFEYLEPHSQLGKTEADMAILQWQHSVLKSTFINLATQHGYLLYDCIDDGIYKPLTVADIEAIETDYYTWMRAASYPTLERYGCCGSSDEVVKVEPDEFFILTDTREIPSMGAYALHPDPTRRPDWLNECLSHPA